METLDCACRFNESKRIISQVFRTNRKITDKFRSTNLGGQIPDTLPEPDVYVDSQWSLFNVHLE